VPLTLVLGPANSARAGEVLGAYAQAARRDALLVVPTAADAAHYDRELAGEGTVLGRPLTFSGLIAEIARRAGYAAAVLTPVQRERLLRRALARVSLPELDASAAAAGFPAATGRLVAELQDARVSPGRFTSAVRAWAGDDPGRRAYAEDLAALYRGYLGELGRAGRVDAVGFASGALEALRATPDRWGATPVFLYGFDDLTGLERDAVELLSRVAGAPVTVSLTYEPGRAALAARARAVEDLRGLADEVRELPWLDEHYDPGARAALHHVERWLFQPGAPRLDPGRAVALLEAGGELAEAELVAAEVLGARREGVPPEEIVVVCRSLARSAALLERALGHYGVPAWSARRVPVAHTALGRALLALGSGDLLAYLRAPGVADPAAVDRFEARVRRGALTDLAAAWPDPLPELDALRRAADPGAELAAQARRLLALAHPREARVLSGEEHLDARAAAAVVEAVEQLAELERGVRLDELLELIAGLEVPAAVGDPRGAVLVAEPLSIRARRFRRVFMFGLCEQEFPSAGAVDPFLDDEQRRELAAASGLALGRAEDTLARERYLFYACASRATERLVLSYRSSDEEGNRVLASPFLEDMSALFVPDWAARRRRRLLADVVWPAAEAPTLRERALSDAAAGEGNSPAAGPPAVAGGRDGETRFLGEGALAHVRHRELLSGGALEAFAACPVRWLVESQLQPEELAPDGDALARGSFMHAVLERVVGSLGGAVTGESLPRAEALLDEVVSSADAAALAAGRSPAVRAAVLRAVEADLRRYLRHEASDGCAWRPEHVELQFGFEEGLPPLVLGSGEVRVRGVIDRVDVSADGREVIVRDYKSGATRPERAGARWRDEHQLQVALYMLAVRRLIGREPVAGFYQPLTGRELRPRGAFVTGAEVGNCAFGTDAMSREELDELLSDIEAQAVELALTLRRGELTPCPETCSRDGCRHPGICWA